MKCPYCQKEAEWVENKEIYGRNYGKSYMIYLCRPCDAYVGCHNNTKEPLGTIANREVREARKQTHAVLDPLWMKAKSRSKERKRIYNILSKHFGERIHVGESGVERCKEIRQAIRLLFN